MVVTAIKYPIVYILYLSCMIAVVETRDSQDVLDASHL